MFKKLSSLLCIFIVSATVICTGQDSPGKPLLASQIFALVAGNALPQNIVHEINTRGLNFHPTAEFQAQLKKAGADDSIFAAINKAGVTNTSEDLLDKELLQHLTVAAGLMADKHYPEAAKELSVALQSSFASTETGFVMGELLRRQEEWEKAALVYEHVLEQDPNFPEAHTKLSYVLYRADEFDGALNEAKEALALNSENPEAHKNAGLALDGADKTEAAIAEYKEALRDKPDYDAVHYDLGLLYYHIRDDDNSVAEYKKAIAINPNNVDYHNNLGTTYDEKGEAELAIHEFREAKKLNPNDPTIRQNLASVLLHHSPNEGIAEFKELENMFPNYQPCHDCLGSGLLWAGDKQGAEAEYNKAIELDPSDAEAHVGLGNIRKEDKNYVAALKEFQTAEQLDPTLTLAHTKVADILLTQKDFAGAKLELKQAVTLSPTDSNIHEMYGQALEGAGDVDSAINEYEEAMTLDPKQIKPMIDLGGAFEKKGDWVNALKHYRRAALSETTAKASYHVGENFYFYNAEQSYKLAQDRFSAYIAKLKADGKSAEADDWLKRTQVMESSTSDIQKFEIAMQNGDKAYQAQRFADAEKSYKQASVLAEKFSSNKQQYIAALGRLGNTFAALHNLDEGKAIFNRQLAVIKETYGPASPKVAEPLFFLATIARLQKDYPLAEGYLSNALQINEKIYGETSMQTSESLRALGNLYELEQSYDKSESYYLRAVKINEALGSDDSLVLIPLWSLCDLYVREENATKSQACYERSIGIIEKQSGANSTDLLPALKNDADALRKLGRANDAAKLDERAQLIQNVAAANKN